MAMAEVYGTSTFTAPAIRASGTRRAHPGAWGIEVRRAILLAILSATLASCSGNGAASPSRAALSTPTVAVAPSSTAAGEVAPSVSPGPTDPSDQPTGSPTAPPSLPPSPGPGPGATPSASPAPLPSLDARGCPTSSAVAEQGLLQLDRTLLVAGYRADYDGTIQVWARNDAYGADDAIPEFAFLDLSMDPIVVDAGGRLTVREHGATLTSVSAARRYAFTGFDVSGGLPQYGGPPPRSLASGAAGGEGWIRLPERPGRWVVELSFGWQTHCYGGSGINWVVVRTR
jgi:hypothetical protein